MDKATASYILKFFPRLLLESENKALTHHRYAAKLEGNISGQSLDHRREMYYRRGLMSRDPEVLSLLENGYDSFELKTGERIVKDNNNAIYFNNCPNCGKLGRTPQAKQCRFCGHGWHDIVKATFQILAAAQVRNRPFYLLGELITGKVSIGMRVDLTILGIGSKPVIDAIDFALCREDSATWEDIGLGISSLDENEKEHIKDCVPFATPLLIEQ
jgi:hypothetical protein